MNRSDWQPGADRAALAARARLRSRVRTFFEATGALEVDTPVLSPAAPTDPHVHPLTTRATAFGTHTVYLQSSPEFPMKRLLAAGVGDCWQLCRVFRDGERGRYHNPEFDLLEWYRVDADHHELMDDVEALLTAVIGPERRLPAAERLSYRDAFLRHADVDPFECGLDALQALAEHAHLEPIAGLETDDRQGLLDRLLAGAIAPAFPRDRPTFVYDWPAAQAALARLDPEDPRVARRFELYWGSIELANGFHELADAREQRARFEADLEVRGQRGERTPAIDERLLAALEHGLPDCAGVALGFDRLVMLALAAEHIDEVLAFPAERA